jgi:4-hydroxythreonine-4-phosphate dehydrogenase
MSCRRPSLPRIGIALGDVTGIGPEVVLKALAAERGAVPARYLLMGDAGYLRRLNRQLGLGLDLRLSSGPQAEGVCAVLRSSLKPLPPDLPPGAPAAARAAVAWLAEGARRCQRHELDALVTAPVNKAAIIRAGQPFVGQTEFLAGLARTRRTAMMLLGSDPRGRWLRVALVTTHLPLRKVPDALSAAKIRDVIELAAGACQDLGLGRARVGVCGLNPHAGEDGQLGHEDQEFIRPAVERARRRGLDVTGPLPADTLFYQAYRGDYDAVVAMYHDQGLAPLKMIGFERGVNWTLGLPFVRTSPDHGTAYDIAGRGVADPASMRAALQLARALLGRRL